MPSHCVKSLLVCSILFHWILIPMFEPDNRANAWSNEVETKRGDGSSGDPSPDGLINFNRFAHRFARKFDSGHFRERGTVSVNVCFGDRATKREVGSAFRWAFFSAIDRDPCCSVWLCNCLKDKYHVLHASVRAIDKNRLQQVPDRRCEVLELCVRKTWEIGSVSVGHDLGKLTCTGTNAHSPSGHLESLANWKIRDARRKKNSIINRADLTDENGASSNNIPVRSSANSVSLAIGGDGYQVIAISSNDNRGREEIASDKQKAKRRSEPKYMRITAREHFGEESWGDPTSGGSVFKTEWRDIDVSYDGKHWFHMLGGFCVQHNPPLPRQ
jgi:hypothetical protein